MAGVRSWIGEIMNFISIDIETFSSNDLSKCGVYKYVEAPDFDILLFGYAVDGGDVIVVDLSAGEEIPVEILAALADENITKWAFNSNFERICLSEWFRRNYPEYFSSYSVAGDTVGNYLNPRGWKCSMIWSAFMGLPLSLAGVGAVLGLEEQKLKEGKELIRYFCVPCKATKSNGGRTRNFPEHDADKWNLFKFYNQRDVEVEQSIQKKLVKYPLPDNGDIYCASASAMFGVPVEKHGQNSHLRQKGKIAELALGYGGSVGALKSMGAIEMGLAKEELQPLVDSWRAANPNIVKFWWDVDRAVKTAVKQKKQADVNGIRFFYQSGMLFIQLPSGRRLAYVKPRMGLNRFDSESVTYEGVGGTKKWERIESYGPKFVENIVQAISRDILCYATKTLLHCMICAHVHDELIIECREDVSLDVICEQMGRTPPWAEGLILRADGYCTYFYKKE